MLPIALSKASPHLDFVVQALLVHADGGRKAAAESCPANVTSRITFRGHNFMQPQPVGDADVYLLKITIHVQRARIANQVAVDRLERVVYTEEDLTP